MTQASLGQSVVQKEIQAQNNGVSSSVTKTQPLWLLAEVTYRCPLHCAFCYNPTDYDKHTQNELTTEQWIQALQDARRLGALQLGISGGEPLLRDDIEDIVIEAKRLGYYSNLITSGVGLTEKRIQAFKEGGLDHIQLSMHDITEEINNFITNTKTFELKKKVAAMIKNHGYPMVLNVVIHRYNIGHMRQILEMAEALGADYIELANTQYYGWSLVNRSQLMPAPTEMSSSMPLGIVNTLASTQPNVARTVVEVTCRFLRLVIKYTAVLPAPAPRVKNVPILSGLPCGKVDTLFTISTMPLGKLSHSLSYVGLSGM